MRGTWRVCGVVWWGHRYLDRLYQDAKQRQMSRGGGKASASNKNDRCVALLSAWLFCLLRARLLHSVRLGQSLGAEQHD